MNTLDFSPLFRTAIGFDRMARMLENARGTTETGAAYPPYNIEKTGEDSYVLTMAVAGFGPDDVEITAQDNTLTITGRTRQTEEERQFLYRGIAGRAFERRFVLAENMVVDSAALEHGLLNVALKRVVPEALKPRRIPIGSARPQATMTLDQRAA